VSNQDINNDVSLSAANRRELREDFRHAISNPSFTDAAVILVGSSRRGHEQKHHMSFLDRAVASKLNYWLGFVADGITASFFLLCGAFANRASWASCGVSIATGAFSWSLIEYSGHRWLFHLVGSAAHQGHKRHHDEPSELLAIPWFTATIVAFALWFALRAVILKGPASFYMAALTMSYLYYGAVHHLYHQIDCTLPLGNILKYRRAYHRIHHKLERANYGVTTAFWDKVFGTHYQSNRSHVSSILRFWKEPHFPSAKIVRAGAAPGRESNPRCLTNHGRCFDVTKTL
jgi:sterol desaturase/sphingolipid hydroxylase (fatty acid hydroxylase superfamily)